MNRIDPRLIKGIAVFAVGVTFDHQNPMNGALVAFGAVNKELARFLLEHTDIVKGIWFLSDTFPSTTEAYREVQANISRTGSGADVYTQYVDATVFGQRGALLIGTVVVGSGQAIDIKGALVP